ncbi:hypothetical protein KQI41_16890 [Tissierella pigra]|uniref:hypothetical protein n=1 Tax=Tissierella pigra TaxID=2607614 RepID=UPI001C1055F4|nr:hypothetical protein [Tissierella pigra]MBU5428071.1 hypothetical protein [Tissierella pigra]
MTRQQNKLQYVLIILFSILETLTLIGAYSAHYFTKTRMGMLRHVVYLNGKWEKNFPISTIKWIAICIIIVLVIFIFLDFFKRDKRYRAKILVMLWTMVTNGWTLYFLFAYGTERNRAYYILSICFILMTLFQNIIYFNSGFRKLKY